MSDVWNIVVTARRGAAGARAPVSQGQCGEGQRPRPTPSGTLPPPPPAPHPANTYPPAHPTY